MWRLSRFLGDELTARGFDTCFTRDDPSKDLAVKARGKKAKGSDIFVSLHSDASDSESVSRVAVFRAYDDKNSASVLAKSLGRAVAKTMGIAKYADKTRTLPSGGEYYGVLRGAREAGCPLYFIIEHGFHTNARDARWLLDNGRLRSLAIAEADVIDSYFGTKTPIAVGDDCLISGFTPQTYVLNAKSALLAAGYDAAIYKDDYDYIGTGDAIMIGGETYFAVVKGDGDGDGLVTLRDADLCRRHIVGIESFEGAFLQALDIDGDGRISIKDYVKIKQQIKNPLE